MLIEKSPKLYDMIAKFTSAWLPLTVWTAVLTQSGITNRYAPFKCFSLLLWCIWRSIIRNDAMEKPVRVSNTLQILTYVTLLTVVVVVIKMELLSPCAVVIKLINPIAKKIKFLFTSCVWTFSWDRKIFFPFRLDVLFYLTLIFSMLSLSHPKKPFFLINAAYTIYFPNFIFI